jgi:hypothetical protein
VLSKPSDLAYLDDIPTLPSYIKSTKITSTTIESPSIIGGTITGGSITSNSTIDVITNARIGRKLIFDLGGAFEWGIQWGEGTYPPSIYYDPVGNSITIGGGASHVYAKGQRIDVAPVAVFG